MKSCDIAIIGGGLVGASLALAVQYFFKQRCPRIALIEPFAAGSDYQPSFDARCTALSYGSRLIYQKLGLWPELSELVQPIERIEVSAQGSFGRTCLEAVREKVPALGYVVENAWLGHCLWQKLESCANIERICPAEVIKLKPHRAGFYLELKDGQSVDTQLAVLADGGRSNLREQLGIALSRKDYQQSAVIANLSTSEPHQNRAFEHFGKDGPLALLPLAKNRLALVWSRSTEEAERLLQVSHADFLSRLQAVFGDALGTFTELGARHSYPLQLELAREQVRSHLVVLGNAAHRLHPIAGQGYNLSLRDAFTLAETLAQSETPLGSLAPLQRFVRRQRLDQQLTIASSDRLPRLFAHQHPLLAALRGLGLAALDLAPAAKSAFARQMMGLAPRHDA
ncbi:2-octaprenyl-6-methoxyphenyl hydroxylase [Ventosimonas gracilis]|uniref:2-octaprenyl-6-methoxyphenyl hydroxylase n=1 Tax=Ventosimonas gracilis TaxID=1680762 RepID=A0A139SHA6_9GAMM|nr:2-octaprenyl-6-methoxyphenyl hydroxylase [Ventosimonas gracilis]KXU33939.1 2-octaprenyl-6-methoxyphenyl hydroxylase [Ventosimonas gracilis]